MTYLGQGYNGREGKRAGLWMRRRFHISTPESAWIEHPQAKTDASKRPFAHISSLPSYQLIASKSSLGSAVSEPIPGPKYVQMNSFAKMAVRLVCLDRWPSTTVGLTIKKQVLEKRRHTIASRHRTRILTRLRAVDFIVCKRCAC
jgi:hypothetical protein